MKRMTTDNPQLNIERLLNMARAENNQAVLHLGDEVVTLTEYVVKYAKEMGCDVTPESVMDGDNCTECDCPVAILNLLGIQAAENNARLKNIEKILGNDYDLDRLRKLVEADKDGRLIIPPAGARETVYHITTCKGFSAVYDGTLYGDDGGPGTATGLYCPCELAENCPFSLDEDGSFDCEKHKNELAVFEDTVFGFYIDDGTIESVMLKYSGSVNFGDFGKTVFKTREEAEVALKAMKEREDDDRP